MCGGRRGTEKSAQSRGRGVAQRVGRCYLFDVRADTSCEKTKTDANLPTHTQRSACEVADLRISVAWGRYRRGLPAALRVRARESRRPCESESSARRGVRSSVGLGATRVPQVLARPTSRHGGAMSPRDRCPGTPREPVPRSTRRPRPFPLYMQVLNQSRVRSDATQCRSDPSDLDSA